MLCDRVLGNVASAAAIVTEDQIRRVGSGIDLCGRRAASIPRGCSLALESLLLAAAGGAGAVLVSTWAADWVRAQSLDGGGEGW